MKYEEAVKNIRKELKDYLQKSGLKSLIIGVSGGLDSTATILLATPVCKELGVNLIGRSISIESNKPDEVERAHEIGQLCDSFLHLDITNTYNGMKFVSDLEKTTKDANKDSVHTKIRHGNVKARMRMIVLYNLASLYEGMVLSTDNYTEYLLGFWTLHGDVGDYGMIQELWKSEVYDMVEWIRDNEIDNTITKQHITKVLEAKATDGLGITNSDLDQILPEWKGDSRSGYEVVDIKLSIHTKILTDGNSTPRGRAVNEYLEQNKDCPVLQRHLASNFKRNNPYNIPRNKIT